MNSRKPKKVHVTFSPCQGEGFEVFFKLEKYRAKVAKYLTGMLGSQHNGFVYFAHTKDFEGFFESVSKERKLRLLNQGREVTMLIDPWEALHIFGYDAHEGVQL